MGWLWLSRFNKLFDCLLPSFSTDIRRYARTVQRAGYPVMLKNFKIVNVMGTANTGFCVDLMGMARAYPNEITFHPDQRPLGCANYRFNDSLQGRIHYTGNVGDRISGGLMPLA